MEAKEVRFRQNQSGPNEFIVHARLAFIKKLLLPFKSAIIITLLVGSGLSALAGSTADAIIIFIIVGFAAVIEWGQQISSAKVLRSLKKYDAKLVRVRRDDKVIEVDSKQLVPGDIVLVAEGEKITADGRIIEINDLTVDESSLTGESLAITKSDQPLGETQPIYQQTNMLFRGTLVQAGRGVYCVTATAANTEFSKISHLSRDTDIEAPIARKIRTVIYKLVGGTVLLGAATISLGVVQGNSLAEMIRFAIALTVSIVPEGLPVTLTVILLLGVQRMAKRHALVRNLAAVETLGMITSIATDKTGTLTQNQMSISEVWDLDGALSGDDNTDFWLSVSHRHPDLQHPIEKLITEYTESRKAANNWQEVDDLPFAADRRNTAVLWQDASRYVVYIKGAPEPILAACRLDVNSQQKVKGKLKTMTTTMRVIAVAKKSFTKGPVDLKTLDLDGFDFEGLIGFKDELRPEVKAAVKATHRAGIKVYMVTGDHTDTARAIAQEAGIIKADGQVAEGSLLTRASESKIAALLKHLRAFGRVLPEHKYKLLKVLKRGEITAMTGDGINDAPALAKADVGIAMGSGTDVAKEAADIVLLDNNFATIVEAIKEGRRTYANIRKMIFYYLAIDFTEAFTVLGGLLAGLPLPLTAAQILWLSLLNDTTIALPLGLEPREPEQMRRPPRRPKESLLSGNLVSRLALSVIVMTACPLIMFWLFLPQGLETARTMTFLSLVAVQWANGFNARSETRTFWENLKYPNYKFLLGVGVGGMLVALALYSPLKTYMHTAAIPAHYFLYLLPILLLPIVTIDLHKLFIRRFAKTQPDNI